MIDPHFAEITSLPSIAEALRATFGNAPIEGAESLRGGLSKAALFKLTVRGRHYVLRHAASSGPENDMRRAFDCMAIAADRGIAPRLFYSSPERGVCITELVSGVTLGESLRSGVDGVEMLGALIRSLHEGPAFPRFMSIPEACRAIASALAQRETPPPFAVQLLARVEELHAVLGPHVVEAPCHCDLNPGNILFDGKRMWMIDWDAACRNDPFHDLATPCIFALKSAERRARLLRAYLGREETRIESARFQLSYALGLSFYAFVFAGIAPASTATPKGDGPITPTGDPARFGEVVARDAQQEYTTREYAEALAVLR